MKYTFIADDGQEKTVRVPDEVLVQGKKEGLTHKETLMRFLSDEGYIVDPVVAELTAKAKANGTGLQARTGKRKPPTRKPDDIKRALIAGLAEYLNSLGNSDADHINISPDLPSPSRKIHTRDTDHTCARYRRSDCSKSP